MDGFVFIRYQVDKADKGKIMSGLDKPIPMSSKRVTNLRGQAKSTGG